MGKTLEAVIREKLSTGYDPVKIEVSAKGVNENNLEVDIEGIRYSVSGNELNCLALEPATESGDGPAEPTTPATEDGLAVAAGVNPDTQPVGTPEGDVSGSGSTEPAAVAEGSAGNDQAAQQSGGAAQDGGDADTVTRQEPSEASDVEGAAEAGTAGDNSREVTDEDQDGDGVEDELAERSSVILEAFGGVELKPVGTADNGATIFGVIAADGEELERGTLLALEELALQDEGGQTPA